ncbi:hypothetical protein HELRODRAFT_138491, partial [Helobdella robusta]|uniref:J domain-containing protein n=1 Tax=Helobdella robusta TaxID=6412 RepID=T1EIV3_HELRO
DLYQILDVPRNCSEDDLKRAYKKMALKFHPDKNQAPGATEAFKSINKAFSILSDVDEKDKYENAG